jgi:hypothetical protein
MVDSYREQIIVARRKGTIDDPFVSLTDTLIIDQNAKATLTEIPDFYEKVVVKGDNKIWNEISNGAPNESQFLVDYKTRLVTFHSSNIGKQLSFEYKGTGLTYISTDSIYTEKQDGIVTETLKDLTTQAQEARDYANEQGEYAETQGNHAKNQGDYAKQVANENKTNWLAPVPTFADIATTYSTPSHGDTVMTHTDGKIYRYFNGTWNHTQTYTDSALTSIQNQLSEQEQQDKVLVHGLNVLSSDQASPLKVEFYGNTLVNLLGRDGNFEKDSDGDGVADGWKGDTLFGATPSLQAENVKYGSKAQRISANTSDTSSRHINKTVNLDTAKYYLVAVDFDNDGNTEGSINLDVGGQYPSVKSTTSRLLYLKFKPLSASVYIGLYNLRPVGEVGWVQFDGIRIYEISQATYDKIGDLSLIGKDQEFVEKAFPYVSGIQSVVNPYVKVSGANLLPPFYEWDLHDNATVVSPYELRLDATASDQTSEIYIPILQNTTYNFNGYGENTYFISGYTDIGGTFVANLMSYKTSGVFTTPSNIRALRIQVRSMNTGNLKYSQPMLTLGSEPRPFVPKNDSYLYAYKVNEETGENEPLILAGNDDKKDISYYNEGNSRWEVKRWFETDVALDGSRDWIYHSYNDPTDGALVKTKVTDGASRTEKVTKYNGDILVSNRLITEMTSSESYLYGEHTNATLDRYLFISISNNDSGWLDGMSLDTDLIKSYFHGWFYRGDGTTHSWRPIGDTDDTRLTTTLPTSPSPTMLDGTIQPYKLTYQLSEPIVEPVTVEGDLSIQGSSQISVGEGLINRESVVPEYYEGLNKYYINHPTVNTDVGKTRYKTDTIIQIYENGNSVDMEKWKRNLDVDTGVYFYTSPTINESAVYSITYEPLDKHDFTTNLNEVVAYYNSSIKSSVSNIISKQSDIATNVSIHAGQLIDILARLRAGGL